MIEFLLSCGQRNVSFTLSCMPYHTLTSAHPCPKFTYPGPTAYKEKDTYRSLQAGTTGITQALTAV